MPEDFTRNADRKTVRVEQTHQLVEHLFRHEAARLTSILTRIFGLGRIDLVEDVVQETLLKALRHWPHTGVPENPSGWMLQTARNAALDVIRREANFAQKEPEVVAYLERYPGSSDIAGPAYQNEIADDMLRMMFACCHQSLPEDAQTAIVLKELCGFSIREIARAFLVEEAAVAQRVARAKRQFRANEIPLEVTPDEVRERLDRVLRTIYLLFNEGYSRHVGDKLISEDLALEAIRLAELVANHSLTNAPKVHALLALMYFQVSRFEARVSPEGELLLLAEQDRSRWNRDQIAKGYRHLELAARGGELSRYHIEAGIASCHAIAESYEQTNWQQVREWYEALREIDSSPVVLLNRAVATMMLLGPQAALEELAGLGENPTIQKYHLFHSAKAECLVRMRKHSEAAESYRKAIALAGNEAETRFLRRKLAACEALRLRSG